MFDPEFARRGAQAAALVSQMTVSTAALGFVGYQLDARLSTDPWLFLVGILCGFAVGLAMFMRGISRLQALDDDSPSDPPE